MVEKPEPSEAPSNSVAFGRWILPPQVLDKLRRISGETAQEVSLTNCINQLVGEIPIRALRFAGSCYDLPRQEGSGQGDRRLRATKCRRLVSGDGGAQGLHRLGRAHPPLGRAVAALRGSHGLRPPGAARGTRFRGRHGARLLVRRRSRRYCCTWCRVSIQRCPCCFSRRASSFRRPFATRRNYARTSSCPTYGSSARFSRIWRAPTPTVCCTGPHRTPAVTFARPCPSRAPQAVCRLDYWSQAFPERDAREPSAVRGGQWWSDQGQSTRQLGAKDLVRLYAASPPAGASAGRPGLSIDRVPALHVQDSGGEDERAGRWRGPRRTSAASTSSMARCSALQHWLVPTLDSRADGVRHGSTADRSNRLPRGVLVRL